jgi:hypothetical protein
MPGTKNIAIINGENHPLPDKLPAPPVEMPMQDIEKTLLFINSIADYVNNRFSRSRISIIYIPTTTSSYQLINEITDVYAEGTATATATATSTYATMQLNDMSNKLCDSMRKIAVANGFNFLDTRPGIREKGKRTLLHGPLDWGHPNEAGYKALSEEIDHFMSALDSAAHGKMVGDCAIL